MGEAWPTMLPKPAVARFCSTEHWFEIFLSKDIFLDKKYKTSVCLECFINIDVLVSICELFIQKSWEHPLQASTRLPLRPTLTRSHCCCCHRRRRIVVNPTNKWLSLGAAAPTERCSDCPSGRWLPCCCHHRRRIVVNPTNK
jgi:hypothetical protein